METEPKKEIPNLPLEISEKTHEELSALFEGREWNGEKFPPVFLKLFSGAHETAKDADGIKPLLDESDIYVPEIFGWSRNGLSILRKISSGEHFDFVESDEFGDKVEEYFFNTNKPIIIIDVPEREVLSNQETYGEAELYVRKLKRFSYEEAVERIFEYLEESAKFDVVNREAYMTEHFSEQIKKIIKEYPELQKKDAIKVLMTLGSGHISIYHALKEIGGGHVSRDFHSTSNRGYGSEGITRVSFGKEISEELKERALLESIFLDGMKHLLDRVSKNSLKNEYFLRYIISLFSRDEIKDVFEQWKGYEDDPVEILYFIIMKKGIVFPKTEEEMDAILTTTPYGKYQKTLQEIKEKREKNRNE
jgi:hypothetical protein